MSSQGDWSRMAKKIFPDANCFLIEPLAEMESFMEKFCEENPGSQYFLVGAGAEIKELTFTVQDRLSGSNFLYKESAQLKAQDKQRRVKVISIDSLIDSNQIDMPQLAKLDVQGFELEVLRGGKKLFGFVDIFILEVSLFRFMEKQPLFHEVVNFMIERGYLVYDIPGFLRRPYDGALGQTDICFVKKDCFLRMSDRWN
ncbi:MAG: FkbM family methyltransferase [Xenococcaceae cyanobacterium MO_188.B32]|nr:FkbM family methyltransferase [Xenococcaceae cyanobacterium MO_188.B32]